MLVNRRIGIFILSLFVFIYIGWGTLYAEDAPFEVRINQIIDINYPLMKVYITVDDEEGVPVLSLIRGNFSSRIDGVEVESSLEIAGFQYTEEPVAYSVLLSAQGLMDGEPLNEQKESVKNLVDAMKPLDTLSLHLIAEEPIPVFENLTKDLIDLEVISAIEANDEQPKLYDSLVAISRKLDQTEIQRKVIFLFSDGRDQESRYDEEESLKIINRLSLPVYTIGIRMLGGQKLNILDEISLETGGSYRYSAKFPNITENSGQLMELVNQSYVLELKSKGVKPDNETHQLMVKVQDKDIESSFYRNFTAIKVPFPFWLKIFLLVLFFVIIIAAIVFSILLRRSRRKKMGIKKEKCPVCRRRMKDDWDECPFCKYLEPKEKKNWKKDKTAVSAE